MSRFANSRREGFFSSLPTASIENKDDTLTIRCKFNFSYFHEDKAGQAFNDLDKDQLVKLMEKLKFYSGEPLSYWKTLPIGKGKSRVLSIYPKFPLKSEFLRPKHVPHQARWGRFRTDYEGRIIGFVLPEECHGKEHPATGHRFDCNTFYIVFLDNNHNFYK
jgi:hypothetical protein